MRRNKAFTLIEVLITVMIIGITLTSLFLVFSRGSTTGVWLTSEAETFKMEASLFWDLQRKVLGSKRIRVENNALYMHTTGGSHFPGVVKCAYYVKDGFLHYYEFPYPYQSINELYEGVDYIVGKVDRFEVYASDGSVDETAYDGLPRFVKVVINDREFVFETFGK